MDCFWTDEVACTEDCGGAGTSAPAWWLASNHNANSSLWRPGSPQAMSFGFMANAAPDIVSGDVLAVTGGLCWYTLASCYQPGNTLFRRGTPPWITLPGSTAIPGADPVNGIQINSCVDDGTLQKLEAGTGFSLHATTSDTHETGTLYTDYAGSAEDIALAAFGATIAPLLSYFEFTNQRNGQKYRQLAWHEYGGG